MPENNDTTMFALIDKLTGVSADLKTLIAVHEVRISQQEKAVSVASDLANKRLDDKNEEVKEIYKAMDQMDASVLNEINKLRSESTERFDALNVKINSLEKYIWTALGGGIVITWLLTMACTYFQAVDHVSKLLGK